MPNPPHNPPGGRRPSGRSSNRQPRPSGRSPVRRTTSGRQRGEVPALKPTSPPPRDPDALRVALVDDDRLVTTMVSRFLQRRGFLVRAFNDPEAALDVLTRDQPDAAIVDMQMPGINGMQLVARLIRRLDGLPFPLLFLTSVEEEASFQEAFKLGVSDYLVKPVPEAELASKLEKAISQFAEKAPKKLPEELGGYKLLDVVRRGQTAVVYRVRRAGRERGLKVLRPEVVGSAESLLRLHREIDVLAACDHPGIMALNASGLEDGFLFYVTDAFPEMSLGRQVSESGKLNKRALLTAMRSLGGALEHLHERGVVVCDISPETIGLRMDGRALITDLAAARWTGRVVRGDEPALPRTRYLAPELFEDATRISPQADIYSLGVVLLESYAARAAVRNRTTGKVDSTLR